MKFLTWDISIIAALGILLAYSLLIRKHKSLATLVSVYIGFALATTWGDRTAQFLAGNTVFADQLWIKANASPFVVKSVLLLLITFLLSTFIKLGGKRARYSALEVTVYAVATAAVTVMFIISFMEPQTLNQVLESSKIVPVIYKWRELLLIAPVFIIIFFGVYSNGDE